ncbi:NUDIX domain-containing protein [Psychrobacter sp.]|uniref:NUDIX domain-containing protein n=1 Tax=Psychrobacter sp. TaxID=56811 RepID=UPI0025FA105D|nr:NUDIX domain-containing protein [Psychrobacter sp.]
MIKIKVAIAVIHYGEQYLLGYRRAEQHQGNRYEFIGGKIESNETAKQALIREVFEEIGLDISRDSSINPLGILQHYYEDNCTPENSKTVCLNIFRVTLSEQQYNKFKARKQGSEGQQLQWVSHELLISNKYKLPDANKTILQWLKLPNLISITGDVDTVESKILQNNSDNSSYNTSSTMPLNQNESRQQWLSYYQQRLPKKACVYLRVKKLELEQRQKLLLLLLSVRADINLIIDYELANYLISNNNLPKNVIAQHLTQNHINNYYQNADIKILSPLPITASAHDEQSLLLVNKLARERIENSLSPVIGVFISPVKNTATHPNSEALGWDNFADIALTSEMPVIALGGMQPEDLNDVREHNGDKVAGITKFLT